MTMFDLIRVMVAGKSSKQLGNECALDQELINQRVRNQERMEAIKRDMGERWVLHPAHKKSRLDTPRPV